MGHIIIIQIVQVQSLFIYSNRCSKFPKCVSKTCEEREECVEPADNEKDAKCVCKDQFVNMGKDDGPVQCELLDPCNTEHRNKKGKGQACIDPSAQCQSYGNGIQDFLCVCGEAFKTEKGIPKMCSYFFYKYLVN